MLQIQVTVSLDESLFQHIKQIAAELNISCDQLVAMATSEYLEEYRSQKMIDSINKVYADEAVQNETREMARRMQPLIRKIVERSW